MVKVIIMEQEFDKAEYEVGLVEINTTAARGHVVETKRMMQIIKLRFQSIVSNLPFNTLTKQCFINFIYYAVMFLNCIPDSQGISRHLSPRQIVTGQELDFNKHCKEKLSSLVEAHEDRVVTNTQHP